MNIILIGSIFLRRFKCKNPFLGDTQIKWWPTGRKKCLPTVSVAADYPDSVPESSNYVPNNGYHQLEEIKNSKRVRETKLTGAEIAKTTIEVFFLQILHNGLMKYQINSLKLWSVWFCCFRLTTVRW